MELYREMRKSFPDVGKLFTEVTLSEFSTTPPADLEKYNFGLGTMIRLKLLRPKSALYKKFVKRGITDRDKMAMTLMLEFHKYMLSDTQNSR